MNKIYYVKESVTHQGIGGKQIDIEFELPVDEVFTRGMNGNWACYNFIDRREDFNYQFPYKLYYGKVNGLGYVIAEDELIIIDKVEESDKIKTNWFRKILCKLNIHSRNNFIFMYHDGASAHVKCRWCGKEGMLDSQGNLF